MVRYGIRPGVRAYVESTADWCSLELRRHLPAIVETLKGTHGDPGFRLLAAAPATPLGQALRSAVEQSSGWALPEDLVFPPSTFPLRARFGRVGNALSVPLATAQEWRDFADLFDIHGTGGHRSSSPALPRLLDRGFLEQCEDRAVSRQLGPGIYRLQHASALVVGEAARVLVDPVSFMGVDDPVRPGAIGQVDAIVLSHGHGDHVCPITLAHYHRDTPMLVYDGLGGSMLCADIAEVLVAAGFTDVRRMLPDEVARIGDVTVTAARFLGEQPWLSMPPPTKRLRTHGLTWLIELNGQKIWFLVDSGFEHGANMIDEAERIVGKHGRVDIVVANMREFYWHPGQIDGSGRYLFCFPRAELLEPATWPHRRLMTLGIDGVSKVATIVGAKCVLPHAHWFHPLGTAVLVDGRRQESSMLEQVRLSCATEVEVPPWQIGDALVPLKDGTRTLLRGAFAP